MKKSIVKIFIPFRKGRPNRETIISKDEIINLTIDLNNLTSSEIMSKYFEI